MKRGGGGGGRGSSAGAARPPPCRPGAAPRPDPARVAQPSARTEEAPAATPLFRDTRAQGTCLGAKGSLGFWREGARRELETPPGAAGSGQGRDAQGWG